MKDITLFPGEKRKAFTISYDDGVRQDKRLLALMEQYQIRGTFNINSGLLGRTGYAVIDGINTDISTFTELELVKQYQGQEIACHGLIHQDLSTISTKEAIYEVKSDQENLERILGKPIKGFAYPFGTYHKEVMKTLQYCGIHYARTVESTKTFQVPSNFLTWHPTCHHNDAEVRTLLEQFCTQNQPGEQLELFYLWGHSYEFEQRGNWDEIEAIFEYLAKYREKIYFGTNEEVYQCLKTGNE